MVPKLPALTSPPAVAAFVVAMVLGVGVDLWTKYLAFDALAVAIDRRPDGTVLVVSRQPDPAVIPGFLQFHVTANQGAVFGIGQGQRTLFLAVSAAAIAFLLWMFAASPRHQRLYHVLMGLLLAGVLGNMYDRMVYGYVRDMILIFADWGIFPWIFNVADSLLCVGVVLLMLHSLVTARQESKSKEARHDTAGAR